MQVGTRDDRIVSVRPALDAPVNNGHLCVKVYAIGDHFRDFSAVSDDEVVAALREARRPRTAANPRA